MATSPDAKKAQEIKHQQKAKAVWEDLQSVADDLKALAKNASQLEHKDRLLYEDKITKAKRDYYNTLKDNDSTTEDALNALRAQLKSLKDLKDHQSQKGDPFMKAEAGEVLSQYEKLRFFLDSNKDSKGGVVSMRKVLMQVTGLLGAKRMVGGMIGKLAAAPGAAYAKAVDVALKLAGDNKAAVTIVKSIDGVARGVKLVGTETLRWVGKKISDLSRTLWRFTKFAAATAGGGALSLLKNLPLLALIGPHIWEYMQNMHKKLKEEYGESYITKILGDIWDTVWGKAKAEFPWLQKVEDFVVKMQGYWEEFKPKFEAMWEYVKDIPSKVGEALKSSFDWIKGKIKQVAKWLGKDTDEFDKGSGGNDWGAGYSGDTSLSAKFNAYTNVSNEPGLKSQLSGNVNDAIKASPDGSIPEELANSLTQRGFSVPLTKIQVSPVTAKSAGGAPMTGTAPVTATPTPSVSSGGGGGDSGAAPGYGQGMGNSLGAAAIPTSVSNDQLNICNVSWGIT